MGHVPAVPEWDSPKLWESRAAPSSSPVNMMETFK